MGRYEIQILDCYQNPTYPDGTSTAVYGQTPPLVNASKPPGEWQTYDVAFTAPRFKDDGSVAVPAYITVFHNGVLTQNHTASLGSVVWRAVAKYEKHGDEGANHAPGPRQPREVPEHLGARDQEHRATLSGLGSDGPAPAPFDSIEERFRFASIAPVPGPMDSRRMVLSLDRDDRHPHRRG